MPILSGFPAGGAGELNFSVVAYASEDDLPATADENTIAVITSTPISGYAFSNEQPDNQTEGFVWFTTGTGSPAPFNAINENQVMVYPLLAKQYVNEAWAVKSSKIYQNGAWRLIATELILYESGNKNNEYTFTLGCTGNAKVTFNSDHILMSGYMGNTNIPVFFIENVNITDFSRAEITYSGLNTSISDNNLVLRILDGDTTIGQGSANNTASGTVSVALGSITGEKRIRVHYYHTSTTIQTVKIHSIKLYV